MKFILDFFILITGIGAASGLYHKDEKLFIISDNSNYLYEYHIPSQELNKHLLMNMDGVNEQVNKKEKLDLEAITPTEDGLLLFPSGSKPNRTLMFDAKSANLNNIQKNDLQMLYSYLRDETSISEEDFNIEGALIYEDNLLLFNRGNGPAGMNGIIKLVRKSRHGHTFTPIDLPKINGHETGFTDAILVDDKIYFLAAAESGKSSYEDGKIGGSLVGRLSLPEFKLEETAIISLQHKFEGITLYENLSDKLTFLLCEDPDNDELQSEIYKLTIMK